VREGCGGIAKVSNAGSSTDAFRSEKKDVAREEREREIKD